MGQLLHFQEMPDVQLVLRIRCDATQAQCPLGIKFGAEPEEAFHLLKLAKSLHLNLVGVSFHVGSGCGEPKVFLRAIASARKVITLPTRTFQKKFLTYNQARCDTGQLAVKKPGC